MSRAKSFSSGRHRRVDGTCAPTHRPCCPPSHSAGGRHRRVGDGRHRATPGYAPHIGRIGALAVALGVGAAVASSPAVAFAEPSHGDGSSNAAGSDHGTKAGPGSPAQTRTPARRGPQGGTVPAKKGPKAPGNNTDGSGTEPGSGGGAPAGQPSATPGPSNGADSQTDQPTKRRAAVGRGAAPRVVDQIAQRVSRPSAVAKPPNSAARSVAGNDAGAARENLLADAVAMISAVPVSRPARVTASTGVEPPAAPRRPVAANLLAAVGLAPPATDAPEAPPQLPGLWTMLALARRELGLPAIRESMPMIVSTVSELVEPVAAALNLVASDEGHLTGRDVPLDEIGFSPEGVAVSPDGDLIYVADRYSGTVTVVDAVSMQPVDVNPDDHDDASKIVVGGEVTGVAVSDTRLYVASWDYQSNRATVQVYDIEDDRTYTHVGVVDVGSRPQALAVNPGGTRLYFTSTPDSQCEGECETPNGTVTVIDLENPQHVIEPIEVGRRPGAMAVSRDGERIFVVNEGDDDVTVIEVGEDDTYMVLPDTIATGPNPQGIAISPAGHRLYITNIEDSQQQSLSEAQDFQVPGQVTVIDTATHQVVQVIPIAYAEGIAANPDGHLVYVISDDFYSEPNGLIEIEFNTPPVFVAETPHITDPDTGVVTARVIFSDADEDELTYSVTTLPERGDVVVDSDGTFTYTPTDAARDAARDAAADGEVLTDSFVVTVDDGYGGTASHTVEVVILPSPPEPIPPAVFIPPGGDGYIAADPPEVIETEVGAEEPEFADAADRDADRRSSPDESPVEALAADTPEEAEPEDEPPVEEPDAVEPETEAAEDDSSAVQVKATSRVDKGAQSATLVLGFLLFGLWWYAHKLAKLIGGG